MFCPEMTLSSSQDTNIQELTRKPCFVTLNITFVLLDVWYVWSLTYTSNDDGIYHMTAQTASETWFW